MTVPGEDHKAGLYVHEGTPQMPGVELLRLRRRGVGPEEAFVPVLDFMRVQRERDELRRALALINALRADDGVVMPSLVVTLLERAGFTHRDAEAMVDIIRQVRGAPAS